MKRRDFITLVVGAAAAWPVTSRGQQQKRTAYVGVFSYLRENDPEAKIYNEAWLKRLAELGWSQGQNLRIEYRWTGCLYRKSRPRVEMMKAAEDGC